MESPFPSLQIFNRVASYPTVKALYTSASTYYASAKETSPLVKAGLEAAEVNITKLVDGSKPLLMKYEPQYHRYVQEIDTFGVQKLEALETQLSALQTACASSKQAIDGKIHQIVESKQAIVSAGVTRVTSVLSSVPTSGDRVKESVASYLTKTEEIFQKYFPEVVDPQRKPSEAPQQEATNSANLSNRVLTLGTRVSKNLAKRVLAQFSKFKPTSLENLKNVTYANLLSYAESYAPQLKAAVPVEGASTSVNLEPLKTGYELLQQKFISFQEAHPSLRLDQLYSTANEYSLKYLTSPTYQHLLSSALSLTKNLPLPPSLALYLKAAEAPARTPASSETSGDDVPNPALLLEEKHTEIEQSKEKEVKVEEHTQRIPEETRELKIHSSITEDSDEEENSSDT